MLYKGLVVFPVFYIFIFIIIPSFGGMTSRFTYDAWTSRAITLSRITFSGMPREGYESLTLGGTGKLMHSPPPEFFGNDRRSARWIALNICIANGASFCAASGEKFWPGQVRLQSYDVVSKTTSEDFSRKSRFQLLNLLSLTEMEILCVIYVRTRPYLTYDIVSWPFESHPWSLILADPLLPIMDNLVLWGFLEVLRPNLWFI